MGHEDLLVDGCLGTHGGVRAGKLLKERPGPLVAEEKRGTKEFKKIKKTRTNSTCFERKGKEIYIRASLFPSLNGMQRLNFYYFSVFLPFGADFAARNSGEVKKKDAKHVGVLFKSL